jgi:hypothetical protein
LKIAIDAGGITAAAAPETNANTPSAIVVAFAVKTRIATNNWTVPAAIRLPTRSTERDTRSVRTPPYNRIGMLGITLAANAIPKANTPPAPS